MALGTILAVREEGEPACPLVAVVACDHSEHLAVFTPTATLVATETMR